MDHKTLGVSVHHLQTVFLGHVQNGSGLTRSSSIYELEDLEDGNDNPGLIRQLSAGTECPIDGRLGSAYVHTLLGKDHVGKANYMLSYTWGYSIGDIVDTLADYCETSGHDPTRTYIYICCLCINQFRVADQKKEQRSGMQLQTQTQHLDFREVFGDRVASIGHLLAMMSPWECPVYISRAWCVFELYTATMSNNNCRITIVMPPQEKLALQNDLFGGESKKGVDGLYDALSKTSVQSAKASVDADRVAILEMVQSNPGYGRLNKKVNDLLRGWVRTTVQDLVSRKLLGDGIQDDDKCEEAARGHTLELASFLNQVCSLFVKNGEYEPASEMVEKALALHQKATEQNAKDTLEHARCLRNHGLVLLQKGKNNEANESLQRAHAMLIDGGGSDNDLDIAEAKDLIGSVYLRNGEYDAALDYLQSALTTRIRILGSRHADTAKSYAKMGHVMYFKKNYGQALREYQRELTVCEIVHGPNHPATANAISDTGAALKHLGMHERALKQHRKALEIRESVLGSDHPDTARTINNIGSVLFHMGKYDHAQLEYQKALTLRQSTLGEDHPYVAASIFNIGTVLEAKGALLEALAKFDDSHAIYSKVVGLDHPNTVSCRERVCKLQSMLEARGSS